MVTGGRAGDWAARSPKRCPPPGPRSRLHRHQRREPGRDRGRHPAAGGTAEAFACDVTDSERVNEVVDEVIADWGSLDILVNNAGITRDNMIMRMKDDQWDAVLNINLRGTFLFTRAAARPMMKGPRGRIINIASVSGLMGNPGQANYSASKAGRDRPDADGGPGTGQPQHHGQRRGAGLHRHRHDRQTGGGGSRKGRKADSSGPAWGPPGRGRRRACSWPARRPVSSPGTS